MRKLMILLLAIVTMASCSQEEKVHVRWATFNMRYDNQGDAPNHWGARKERVAQYIKDMKFDVFGTQEVLHHQFEDLKALLPDFEGVGVGRDDGATKGGGRRRDPCWQGYNPPIGAHRRSVRREANRRWGY